MHWYLSLVTVQLAFLFPFHFKSGVTKADKLRLTSPGFSMHIGVTGSKSRVSMYLLSMFSCSILKSCVEERCTTGLSISAGSLIRIVIVSG